MNSNLTLECKETTKPHPEGVHNAVCVDVIDLGFCEIEFQGTRKTVQKVRLVFETEATCETGARCTISRSFTASLHPKAKLAEFLGKWRGRPVLPGETIDLTKVIGISSTLMVSHQQNKMGGTYGSIDAIAKPTKKVLPSGQYDPDEARKRIAEAKAREFSMSSIAIYPVAGGRPPRVVEPVNSVLRPEPVAPKTAAPVSTSGFDPEIGF